MDIDRDHIDDAVLALLFLGRHDGMRTWKSFDWAAMERLHKKGLISDPVGKAKSVVVGDARPVEARVGGREEILVAVRDQESRPVTTVNCGKPAGLSLLDVPDQDIFSLPPLFVSI